MATINGRRPHNDRETRYRSVELTVRFLESVRPKILDWLESCSEFDPEQSDLAHLTLELWQQRLRDLRGDLPEAIRSPDLMPDTYYWQVMEGWWLGYIVRKRRRWFRTAECRITIFDFARSESIPDFPQAHQ